MNPLQQFYQNEVQREALRAFMVNVLREMAADQAFRGETVAGIREGSECVEKTFDKLEELYGTVIPVVTTNSR